jgi:hypothetical protein
MTVLLKAQKITLGISPELFDILSAASCALTQVNMRPPACPAAVNLDAPIPLNPDHHSRMLQS